MKILEKPFQPTDFCRGRLRGDAGGGGGGRGDGAARRPYFLELTGHNSG